MARGLLGRHGEWICWTRPEGLKYDARGCKPGLSTGSGGFPLARAEVHKTMSRLRIEDLRYHIFGPIDLEIEAGECVGLAGPSGSGKSLLLRALADLDPYSGTLMLDETHCGDLSAPRWRRLVGMLPAEPQWWEESVGDHFTKHFTKDDPAPPDPELLGRLGFAPDVMEWSIGRLSSGERQRLGLARLLAARPRALLLDEPTANLDPANVGTVEALLAEYRTQERAPVLWVTHDPAQMPRVAARGYRMEQGRLIEQVHP